MALQTNGIGHVAIRVTDMARSKDFYVNTLGFQQVLETDDLLLVIAGGTLLGLRGSGPGSQDRFDPFRVGLDHLALHVDPASLDGLKQQLDEMGVPNNGVEDDSVTGARYISFSDPDGIAWELYGMAG